MMGIKLNAQVIVTNLQNMHEKSLHFLFFGKHISSYQSRTP